MRAFIAIELPKNIKDLLAGLQEGLKKSGADVKWVAPENIHLTLKFLGELDDETLEKIKKIVEIVAAKNNNYKISLSSLGAFPKIDYPRVIWAGLEKGTAETEKIAKELEERIEKFGIPKEDRAFSCHITLGRARPSLNREKLIRELKNSQEGFAKKALEFEAAKITLFKSTLNPKGASYETLKEASLKTT